MTQPASARPTCPACGADISELRTECDWCGWVAHRQPAPGEGCLWVFGLVILSIILGCVFALALIQAVAWVLDEGVGF